MRAAELYRLVIDDIQWMCDDTKYKVLPVLSHSTLDQFVRVWLTVDGVETPIDTHYEYGESVTDVAWCILSDVEEFLFNHRSVRFTL